MNSVRNFKRKKYRSQKFLVEVTLERASVSLALECRPLKATMFFIKNFYDILFYNYSSSRDSQRQENNKM